MTDTLSLALERTGDWVDLIQTLVDIDSGPGDAEGMSAAYDVLATELESLGFTNERVPNGGPDVLVARRASSRAGAPRLGLLGHVDTVFAKGTPTERPFRVEGDRLTGPGVADMKAGLVVAIGALQLAGESVLDALDVTIIFNGDEESGSADSRDTILQIAESLDAAFVFEAGRLPNVMVKARRGAHRFDVVVSGKAAHTGVNPQDGANAIEAIAHHVLAIQELGRTTSGATVNVAIVNGGSRPNIVPDRAVARVDSRFDTDEAEASVVAGMQSLAGRGPVEGTSTEVISLDRRPAFNASADALADRYLAAASRLGFTVEAAATGGSSDGNFTSSVGVPTIDGLGAVGGGYHTADEFANTNTVADRAAIMATLLAAIAEEGL